MKTCAHPTCAHTVPDGMLACKFHWFILAKPLRDAIWRTHRAGDRRAWSAHVLEARAAWLGETRCGHCQARVPRTAGACKIRPAALLPRSQVSCVDEGGEIFETSVPAPCARRFP